MSEGWGQRGQRGRLPDKIPKLIRADPVRNRYVAEGIDSDKVCRTSLPGLSAGDGGWLGGGADLWEKGGKGSGHPRPLGEGRINEWWMFIKRHEIYFEMCDDEVFDVTL